MQRTFPWWEQCASFWQRLLRTNTAVMVNAGKLIKGSQWHACLKILLCSRDVPYFEHRQYLCVHCTYSLKWAKVLLQSSRFGCLQPLGNPKVPFKIGDVTVKSYVLNSITLDGTLPFLPNSCRCQSWMQAPCNCHRRWTRHMPNQYPGICY